MTGFNTIKTKAEGMLNTKIKLLIIVAVSRLTKLVKNSSVGHIELCAISKLMLNAGKTKITAKEAAALVAHFQNKIGGIVIHKHLLSKIKNDLIIIVLLIGNAISQARALGLQIGQNPRPIKLRQTQIAVANQAREMGGDLRVAAYTFHRSLAHQYRDRILNTVIAYTHQ